LGIWQDVYKAMQKQGESMPGSSSKEEFVGSNDNPFNEHSQHVPKEGPQRQRRECVEIGGLPPRRWNVPSLHFLGAPKY